MSYIRFSQANIQAQADANGGRMDGKYIIFYAGTPPATADTALIGANVQLGTCLLATPATAAADITGKLVFNLISPDANTDANGVATFARISELADANVECQIDVGTSGTAITLNTTSFTINGTVTVTSMAIQHTIGN